MTGISWAKVTCDKNELIDWNYENFTYLPQKMDLHETFDLAIDILNKIPPSDVYVFESTRNNSVTQTQANITSYNHQMELTSMLFALINTSSKHNQSLTNEEDSFENKVYRLRAAIPAR